MQPAPQNLVIYQGDDFDFFFRLRNRVWDAASESYIAGSYIDLTGYTGKAQIRVKATDADPLAEFVVTITDQATIPGGVLMTLSHTVTAGLPTSGAVWDVQLTDGAGAIRTYIAGSVQVIAEVTRP